MKVILFGATGMVGKGVLRQCLIDPDVESVLSIGRKPSGVSHPKLRDLVRADMFDFNVDAGELNGYDTCFFCLGVSSVRMSESEYTHLTYDLTMGWAHTLARANPAMRFLYVSGMGTGGKAMWARVKSRTEVDLLALFPAAIMIRLGALRPMHGERARRRRAALCGSRWCPRCGRFCNGSGPTGSSRPRNSAAR
jgi:nucleoside-diphosphate-sugar epimerase